ncbi:iron ABC transporter permease [Billgrantia azerbaijanica]|nr:iron ABC transporter permease [Halomonas azerbaijanica]
MVLCAALLAEFCLGATTIPVSVVADALLSFDPDNYDHYVVLYQRLPRVLIALHAGALMACGGLVLQGLTRNPLASPTTMGINAGAMLFVLAGAYFLNLGIDGRGAAALLGGMFGFATCLGVARLAGLVQDQGGLALILSGALTSMLLFGIANAILLTDPTRRTDFLGWVSGNINHVYADQLFRIWWIGLAALALLCVLARPLTLIMLGTDKAASAGVNVRWVRCLALLAVVLAASSSVAVCGPLGFVGLVVPHIVRPFAGADLTRSLPGAALVGATACLLADLIARHAFLPAVVHTGLVLDLVGGVVFALIVRRYYLTAGRRASG